MTRDSDGNIVETIASNVEAGGAVTLSATDNSTINASTVAGTLAISVGVGSGSVAVGAAIAVNNIINTVRAYIDGSTIESDGAVNVKSTETSLIFLQLWRI